MEEFVKLKDTILRISSIQRVDYKLGGGPFIHSEHNSGHALKKWTILLNDYNEKSYRYDYFNPTEYETDKKNLERALLGTRHSDCLSIEKTEKNLIQEALRRSNGNRRIASEMLEINERTLYRKINNYGLEHFRKAKRE